MEVLICLVTILLTQFDAGVGGEYCFKSFMETQYCSFGCCGTGFYKECCSSTGPIIGICIGLTVLVVIIIIVICCCKRQATRGSVLGQQTTGYGVNTGGVGYQQPVVYQQQPGQQTYVYPTAQVGYTPVPPAVPPTAQMGYPYPQQTAPVSQMGYQQHPPPAQPSYGYSPQQMPVPPANRSIDMQTTQGQSNIEPSAPPPSYEDVLKVPQ